MIGCRVRSASAPFTHGGGVIVGKLRDRIDRFEENFLLLLLLVSVILIFMQVVMRYVFQNSLSWSEELGRYLFIWLTWLSTGYAVRQKRHLRIEMVGDLLSERGKLILDIAAMTMWCAFTIFLVVKGWGITSMIFRRGQLTAALEIPAAFTYAAVPVGAAIMAARLVDETLKQCRRLAGMYMREGEER